MDLTARVLPVTRARFVSAWPSRFLVRFHITSLAPAMIHPRVTGIGMPYRCRILSLRIRVMQTADFHYLCTGCLEPGEKPL